VYEVLRPKESNVELRGEELNVVFKKDDTDNEKLQGEPKIAKLGHDVHADTMRVDTRTLRGKLCMPAGSAK